MSLSRTATAICLLATSVTPALAGPGEVVATYERTVPADDFGLTANKTGRNQSAGVLYWQVPAEEFGTGGLDRAFTTFCADPLTGVSKGNTYRFRVQPLEAPDAYDLPATDAGKAAATRKALYLRELYGRHYPPKDDHPGAAAGFQLAVWELIVEPDPKQLGLHHGAFRVEPPADEDARAGFDQAEKYLRSLEGDETSFALNPELVGRELVRLKGLPSGDDGLIPQAQLALQYVVTKADPDLADRATSTGAAGTRSNNPPADGGMMPAGNGAFGGGGLGGGAPFLGGTGSGFGSSGGFPFVGGGGGTGTVTSVPTFGTTGTAGQTPSILVPVSPGDPGTRTPIQPLVPVPPVQGTNPTTPIVVNAVPGPPGLLLGAVALGVLAVRQHRKYRLCRHRNGA